jgi:hypothetical protein
MLRALHIWVWECRLVCTLKCTSWGCTWIVQLAVFRGASWLLGVHAGLTAQLFWPMRNANGALALIALQCATRATVFYAYTYLLKQYKGAERMLTHASNHSLQHNLPETQ